MYPPGREMSMQEAEEKTTDVFYRFRKRDILKENGLRRNGKGRIRMKRAYFNCILLDGTEQLAPVAFFAVIIRIISKTSASRLTVPISATMAVVTVW